MTTATSYLAPRATSIAAAIVRIADKHQIMPKDVIHFPHHLRAGGVDPSIVTPEILTEATRLDRQESKALLAKAEEINAAIQAKRKAKQIPTITHQVHQSIGITVIEPKPAKEPKIKTPAPERIKIMGHAPTAVLRWMGKMGWDFAKASKTIANLGCDHIAEGTIRIQLNRGKKGTDGAPAELTPYQIRKVKEASK